MPTAASYAKLVRNPGYEAEDLATGIQWVLQQQKESKSLSLAARRHAEYMFDPVRVAQQYVTVYKEAMNIQQK